MGATFFYFFFTTIQYFFKTSDIYNRIKNLFDFFLKKSYIIYIIIKIIN